MAIQTFTSGQTLTAAQMTTLQQNDYNWSTSAQTASYVLVAADAGKTVTMTNAGATTITVNTSLFTAGDTIRILNLGAGACTITAGTATVNTAGSLVLTQYACGTLWFSSASAAVFIPDDRGAGLTLVTSQTIGSAVSSVTVNNAFSSTYDNYRITISGGSSSATQNWRMQLGATTTGYYFSGRYNDYSGAGQGFSNAVNAASWNVGACSANGNFLAVELYGPNLADETAFSASFADILTGGSQNAIAGFLNNTTQYTAFTLFPGSGTVTGGTIRVYGYQNS